MLFANEKRESASEVERILCEQSSFCHPKIFSKKFHSLIVPGIIMEGKGGGVGGMEIKFIMLYTIT